MVHSTLDLTFAALSDPTRRGVIELLRSEPRRASDLADSLGTSRPAMSRHLRVLRTSGLVDAAAEDDARERIYRLCPDPFAQLRTWLEQVEAFWTLQLASFKDHVEKKNRVVIAGDQVRVTVTVDVAPDVAFNAFTTEIDRWWRRGVKYRVSGAQPGVLILEPRVGGRLFEQFDDNTHEAGKVTVFDPPNHLAFEWRGANFAPDERTVVEVTFTRTERGATRLDLVHRGFAALRPDHPVRHGAEVGAFLRSIGLWWGDQLSSLREVVS